MVRENEILCRIERRRQLPALTAAQIKLLAGRLRAPEVVSDSLHFTRSLSVSSLPKSLNPRENERIISTGKVVSEKRGRKVEVAVGNSLNEGRAAGEISFVPLFLQSRPLLSHPQAPPLFDVVLAAQTTDAD